MLRGMTALPRPAPQPKPHSPPSERPISRIGRRAAQHFGYDAELLEPGWTPRARAAVALLGAGACLAALRLKRLPLRSAVAYLGTASAIRAITNRPVTEWVGWLLNPAMHLSRTILVRAPVEDVYDFLRDFSNFPKFMSYVRSVELNDQGGLRWTLAAPGNLRVSWNSVLGALVRNQSLSWKSLPGSIIRNFGRIDLAERPGEGTWVRVQLTYAPPAGALGYAAVHLLGFDPKTRIDDDLEILKTLIESTSAQRGSRESGAYYDEFKHA